MTTTIDSAALETARDQRGTPLGELSREAPVLLTFLRHFG